MNRKLLHELLDAVLDVQELGYYAGVEFHNAGYEVFAKHMIGEFDPDKDYGLFKGCDATDNKKIRDMIDYFRSVKMKKS